MGVEAGLGGGAAAGPAERLLLGRERLLVLAAARPAPGLAGEAARLVLGVPREVAGAPLGLALEPLGPLAVPVVVPAHAAPLLVLEGAPEATVEGAEGEAEHDLTLPAG